MSDIDKAREWAKRWEDGTEENDPFTDWEEVAAIKIIKSLPDQWLDFKKVLEEADRMDKGAENAMKPGHNEFSRGYAEAMQECAEHLRNLLTPSLPTLAELIEAGNAPKQYQWMRAKDSNGEELYLTRIKEDTSDVVYRDGMTVTDLNSEFTPLPGEPKLKLPGSEATVPNEKKVTADQQPNNSETPKSSIKPEDVPPNEPWLIEVDGQKAIGTRYKGDAHAPWVVAALDGSFLVGNSDNEITLIHKLVPETHTLPKGMRVADHEEYGRVVVSPKVDNGGDSLILVLDEGEPCGAYSEYCKSSEFNFLDGNQ